MTLRFPGDRSLGYLHIRDGGYPFEFHGRFKKEGGMLEDNENAGWRVMDEARGVIKPGVDGALLLEVLPEAARDLSPLAALDADALDAIWLGNTFADDEQLANLAHLTGLVWLDVQNNGAITDAGMDHLRGLTALRSLGLHWTRVTDASIDVFIQMTALEHLDIWGCEITETAVARLRDALPRCEIRTE
jgi:hypothetical protein